MRSATFICLDLDDTLWELGPVITRAEQGLHAWLRQHYPRVAERYSIADIAALRAELGRACPRAHDLGALRRETYRRMAGEAGYGAEMVEQAFVHFQALRNQVTLYDDVLPALRRLAARGPLVAMTNGNADLEVIGIRQYFQAVFSASTVGVAKPDPDFFARSCQALGVAPQALLHVGNDPEHDVLAPQALGITAVWVNRKGAAWPAAAPPPRHQVRDLAELAGLLDG
jgi:putative hydrolase of the HAD superfamily